MATAAECRSESATPDGMASQTIRPTRLSVGLPVNKRAAASFWLVQRPAESSVSVASDSGPPTGSVLSCDISTNHFPVADLQRLRRPGTPSLPESQFIPPAREVQMPMLQSLFGAIACIVRRACGRPGQELRMRPSRNAHAWPERCPGSWPPFVAEVGRDVVEALSAPPDLEWIVLEPVRSDGNVAGDPWFGWRERRYQPCSSSPIDMLGSCAWICLYRPL
jgi:hypothetical protein